MKYIEPIITIIGCILGIALGIALICYTSRAVEAGDICKTIWGCFGLWIWFNLGKKENTK
jgi:hypothetical protein